MWKKKKKSKEKMDEQAPQQLLMVYNFDRLKTTTATDYTDLVLSAQKKFILKIALNIMSVIVVCFFIYFLTISVIVRIQKI